MTIIWPSMCNKDMFDIDVVNTYVKYLGLWICHNKLIIDALWLVLYNTTSCHKPKISTYKLDSCS